MLLGIDVAGVGGMTLGADPLVSAVTVVSYNLGRGLPGFIVRKQSKGHGTNQFLEGLTNFKPGDKVAMLEDVVTTGGTLIKACQRVREAGLDIVAVLAVLDRQEGGSENLAQAGYALRSIFTRADQSTSALPTWLSTPPCGLRPRIRAGAEARLPAARPLSSNPATCAARCARSAWARSSSSLWTPAPPWGRPDA